MIYNITHTDLTDLTDFSCAGADLMSHRSYGSHRFLCAWKDACVRQSVKINLSCIISDLKKSVRSVRSV